MGRRGGLRRGLRPGRRRLRRSFRFRARGGLATHRRRPHGRPALVQRPAGPARHRSGNAAARRPLHHLPRLELLSAGRPSRFRRPGPHRPLRPRPRLPSRDETPHAPDGPGPDRTAGRPFRRPLVRRRRAHARPRRRRPRRPGLVRQERQHPQSHLRFLAPSGPDHHRPAADCGRPSRQDLRPMLPLHARVSHRRHRRPLRRRQSPLHQLPDHRAQGRNTHRIPRGDGQLGLRMRHLPGSLPGQPQGQSHRGPQLRPHRPFLCGPGRTPRDDGRAVPATLRRHPDHARQARRHAAQRLRRPGKLRRPLRRAGFGSSSANRSHSGPAARRVGVGSHRW